MCIVVVMIGVDVIASVSAESFQRLRVAGANVYQVSSGPDLNSDQHDVNVQRLIQLRKHEKHFQTRSPAVVKIADRTGCYDL